ncbi:aspartic proteinase-like protein 1 isoform X1 [Panicum miliaceum]|uniref:Aspartic proteinase-like protein 1 isoform X1 n=1 Tax=Panicum miliaceum TaxID=4540 RepID=A0A3L6RTF8_PANMI|nr:aspartic proteinase-like protein 1 isoform X1 [Panicum miliaceum]
MRLQLVFPLLLLAVAAAASAAEAAATLSLRMVHRLSDEARLEAGPSGERWPRRGSGEYYRALVRSDLQRQKRRLGVKYQLLSLSKGGGTFSSGGDLGWLYYTWVDVGTPNTSFLVALDTGSDLFWVPCDCIQCAPLSGYRGSLVFFTFNFTMIAVAVATCKCSVINGASIMQDRDLGIYKPAESTTSRHLPCSHELCLGSGCTNPKQPCPYNIEYFSENTTSSGLLIEDTLHFYSREGHVPVNASVIIGCGRKQSGDYLDGVAPDGLLGLGMADISVPSFLARVGLVRNSFSMCFKEDNSGRIFIGDQGVSNQQSTPFVPLYGKLQTYAVNVDKSCIGHKCLEGTSFEALVDSGTSFTSLPPDVYKAVTVEFDKQMNASRVTYEDSALKYCYSASPLEMPDVPTITLTFAANKSFQAVNPILPFNDKQGALAGFCLAILPSSEPIGIIAQNFLVGYHVVFDRENMKLGWYRSECRDVDNNTTVPLGPSQHNSPEDPLPSNEQQTSPAVTPAFAGTAPPSSATTNLQKLLASSYPLLLPTMSTVFFMS